MSQTRTSAPLSPGALVGVVRRLGFTNLSPGPLASNAYMNPHAHCEAGIYRSQTCE